MSGFVQINRAIWENPDFQDSEMSQREAFIWMIAHAAWKPTKCRVGKTVVKLQRGQLAFSVRFLAEKFGWSKSRVHRFLDMLKNRDTIGTSSGTAVTVITICNYGRYQLSPKESGTHPDLFSGQQRDSSGTKKNTNNTDLSYCDARECELDPVLIQCLEAAGLSSDDLASRPNLTSHTDILNLTQPVNGEPCDLERDVLPAIRAGAAKLAEKGQTLNSWRYFREASIRNRDERLAGTPDVRQPERGTAASFAGGSPGQSSNPAFRLLSRLQASQGGGNYPGGVQEPDAFTIDHEEVA